jgi:TPR repeat protein
MRVLAVLSFMAISGCSPSSENRVARATERPNQAAASGTCITDVLAAKLAHPPVEVDAAYRLADFYGVCLQDGRGLEKWLRVAAQQGDTKAMYSLASIIERQPGRAREGAEWRRKANEATRRPEA